MPKSTEPVTRPVTSLTALTLLAALALSGCQPASRRPRTDLSTVTMNGAPLAISNPETTEPDPRLTPARSNITVVTYSGPHGTQVSYYSPNGKIYLWYPGNTAVLQGEWKTAKPLQLCYRYAIDTVNPYANQPGGRWVCRNSMMLLFGLGGIAERRGDVFGLAKQGAPPFVSRKGREQYNEILAKLPPASPDDTRSRIAQVADKINAERIAEADRRIWEKVGQPPAGQETGTETAPSEQ